jgi:hypothetical protein
MDEAVKILLEAADVKWAILSASASIEKWSGQAGYYNNRFDSHFKGKLGELATEKYLLEKGYKLDSHFRFPERENLSDLVIKIRKYTEICRLEVKTWEAKYWPELGRCISIEQYPDLKKKADIVLWCVIDLKDAEILLKNPQELSVSLIGWSKIGEITNAPVKDTGIGGMRRVKNYQLLEADLHSMSEFIL